MVAVEDLDKFGEFFEVLLDCDVTLKVKWLVTFLHEAVDIATVGGLGIVT